MRVLNITLTALLLGTQACERRSAEPTETSMLQRADNVDASLTPGQRSEDEAAELEAELGRVPVLRRTIKVHANDGIEPGSIDPGTKYTLLGAPEALHYSNVLRWQARLEVPKGLTRDQVAVVLERAAYDLARDRPAHAVSVLAYGPSDDSTLAPTVGRGVLAPNGRWSDVEKPDAIRFRLAYFNDAYLQPTAESEQDEPVVEYRPLGAPEALHYSDVYRWQIRIEIPKGLSRNQVTDLLERAARDTASGRRANAVAVLAYTPGDNSRGVPTVGRGVLAPNGDWADAAEPAPLLFKLEAINDSYLNPSEAIQRFTPGTKVRVHASLGESFARVTRYRDRWERATEIAQLPEGTEVLILERHSEAFTPEFDFVRYRIEFEQNGRTQKGWVHQSVVEGHAE